MAIHSTRRRAFSLFELMLVVVILGIIASLVVPRLVNSADDAKVKTCRHNHAEINSAVERYYFVNGDFPADLSDLETIDYFPIGIPVCPVTGNAYTLNATTHHVEGHTSSANPGDH